jgi:ATP-dependent helicase/nuclease subunit A
MSAQPLIEDQLIKDLLIKDLLIKDQANRQRALELASFIVEAPAGAGKTELLTQRYLKLLQTVNNPEEIIAITFTNKAAAEMRLRILDSLIAAANKMPPTLPHKQITYDLSTKALEKSDANNWQLIENPSRLRIFTIDSLCAHLARQMPLLSRFGAQPKVADDANILYAQAAEQTLALLEHKDHGDTVKTALRYVENNAAQLTGLLVSMLQKRDQWLSHANNTVDSTRLQNTLNYLIAQTLNDAKNALPLALQQVLMPVARYAASNQPASLNIDLLLDWQNVLTAEPADLAQWRAVADLMLTDKGLPRKEGGLTIKFGFPATDEGRAHKKVLVDIIGAVHNTHALRAARSLPYRAAVENDWGMISALSQLLNLAVAQLWLVFQTAGEVDFVEIAQRATQALVDESETPTDLALKLDYQIQHLLVDEFQDTSPSQIKLLEQLTRGWQTGDARTLFCVGDPMQSIYRFRKANVSLFINAAQRGIGDIQLQRLQLYRNNRATPQIVGWLNQTFAPLFAEFDDEAQGAVKYRPSIADASKDAANSSVEVHAIIKNDSTEAAKQHEAEAVISIIQRERTANPNAKIAILVSAKNHLALLVTSLRRSHTDIKFQALDIEALAGRQIVQDLLSLTHALHHKADRVHWLAILRAPWCGLNLHDLHALAGVNHHATIWQLMQSDALLQTLSSDGQARLQHVRTIFDEAFAAQGRTNTSRWIRGVWLMLNGPACLWEQADVIDVQAFFSCLDSLDKRNQFSPERMCVEIEKLFAAPDADGEQLQMMTIHKSKGLEFDTVILLGLGTAIGGNNSEKPLLLWEEVSINKQTENHTELLAAPFIPKSARDLDSVSVYDFLEAREKLRDANEDARVLYVAATRAERKLHLVGFATQGKDEIKPAANTPLALLWPAVSHYFEDAKLNGIEAAEKTEQLEDDIANFTPQLVRLKQLQMPTTLQSDIAKKIAAPTSLQTSSSTKTAAPNLAADVGNSVNLAADCGSLAHLYMELIAKQGLSNWPASRIDTCSQSMQFWLLQRGHAKNEVEKQVPQIVKALERTITSPQAAWILAPRASLQTELSMSTTNNQNQAEEQRIDITFVEKNVRWIIDYKLGLDVTEANCEATAQAHKPQLARYASLFTHENLPIKTAVFFLSLGKLVELA